MSNFTWVAVAVVTILSTARITRLVVFDHWPPSIWLRMTWDRLTHDGKWSTLIHCGYCFAVWAGLGVVLWGYFVDFNTIWWVVNGWLGASYAAAIVVAFDGDD